MLKKVGILALQGSVIEHSNMLKSITTNIEVIEVKNEKNLNQIDGIILPGGESTAIGLLLNKFNLMNALREKIQQGLPVWGTCAGMILLAKEIDGQEEVYLQVMDISVKRNSYGSQLHSFITKKYIDEINKEIEMVFIRAPHVIRINNDVKVVCSIDDKIVAVRQKNMLATSFHPELTNQNEFHKYFINTI